MALSPFRMKDYHPPSMLQPQRCKHNEPLKPPYVKQHLVFVLPCSIHSAKTSLQLIHYRPALKVEHFIFYTKAFLCQHLHESECFIVESLSCKTLASLRI